MARNMAEKKWKREVKYRKLMETIKVIIELLLAVASYCSSALVL